jgi:hypothetical protein
MAAMSERTVMEVVSDIRKHCQTVELSILVDELVILVAKTQADADAREANRAAWRERKRKSREVTGSHVTSSPSPSPPMINNSSTPLSSPPKILSENPLFEEFWKVYPRKVEKGVARKAWRNALKRATAEEIIAGAKRYAALKLDLEFTKHPGPWLNADRWLDEGPKVEPLSIVPKRTWAEQRAEREGQ